MIVKVIIQCICVVVPIILIIKLVIEYTKSIGSDDQNMVISVTKSIPTRVIAIIVIFGLPMIIKLIVFIGNSDANDYYSCIENATPEMIQVSYQNKANDKINKVKETYNQSDYDAAKISISNIKDKNIRDELYGELDSLKKYVDIKNRVDSLINNYDKKEFIELSGEIENIKDEEIKNYFTNLMNEISSEKLLSIESGSFKKKFTGTKDWLNYWEYIPNNATTNMPIVIFLHGDGQVNNIDSVKDIGFIAGSKKVYGDDYPYIILQPNTRVKDWTADHIMTTVKELIDYTCEEYSCDTEHIIITGMSRGSIGTWAIANKYTTYFSAVVPISCGGGFDPKNFVNLPVRAFVGGAKDEYNRYYGAMYSNVRSINNAGGNATLEVIPGGTHGSTYQTVYSTKEVIEWMLEQ